MTVQVHSPDRGDQHSIGEVMLQVHSPPKEAKHPISSSNIKASEVSSTEPELVALSNDACLHALLATAVHLPSPIGMLTASPGAWPPLPPGSGPGCSSVGGGFLSELGPFYPKPGGKTLKVSPGRCLGGTPCRGLSSHIRNFTSRTFKVRKGMAHKLL